MKVSLLKDHKTDKDGKKVVYWLCRWYDQTGRRRSKSLGRADKMTKRHAQKEALRIEQEFDRQPGRRNAQKMKLKEYLDTVFDLRKELAPSSIARYKDTTHYLLHYFGDTRQVDGITPQDAARFHAALSAGKLASVSKTSREVGKTSVALHVRNSKALFNFGVKNKMIFANPFENLSGQAKTATSWHYISPAEFHALMEAVTPSFRAMIALCRLAGLRRLEAYYLEWQDVNFDKNRIYICGKKDWQPKDKESRSIPLCPELGQILLQEFQNAPEGQTRVCPESNIMNINRAIKDTIKRAGLQLWSKPLHSMRKSAITDFCERYPIHAVMQWSGHSDISTTQRYYTQVNDAIFDQAATDSFWKRTAPHDETVIIGTETKTEKQTENEKTETPVQ